MADNVTLSRLESCARGGWIDLRRQRERTEDVMGRLRIKAAGAASPVARLSGGNQQKVALGRLLHQDPDILLLDEPARGVDVASKSDIYRQISRLAGQGKAAVEYIKLDEAPSVANAWPKPLNRPVMQGITHMMMSGTDEGRGYDSSDVMQVILNWSNAHISKMKKSIECKRGRGDDDDDDDHHHR